MAPVVAAPVVVEEPPARPDAAGQIAPDPDAFVPKVAADPKVTTVPPQVVSEWHESQRPAPPSSASPQTDVQADPTPQASFAPPASSSLVMPRRAVAEDGGRADVPWLGICSWLLLCCALFASLIGWPSQASLDRVSRLWAEGVWTSAPAVGLAETQDPASLQSAAVPEEERHWTPLSESAGDPQALPPTDLAPPIAPPTEWTVQRIPGGPPLPQFKPIVDGVAAQFSNAFFEIGDRLQQEGDNDAAVHMRL
ncbi:MAG: hypothetical protein AAF637_24985, partial [Pseudomonadota bacterium]